MTGLPHSQHSSSGVFHAPALDDCHSGEGRAGVADADLALTSELVDVLAFTCGALSSMDCIGDGVADDVALAVLEPKEPIEADLASGAGSTRDGPSVVPSIRRRFPSPAAAASSDSMLSLELFDIPSPETDATGFLRRLAWPAPT